MSSVRALLHEASLAGDLETYSKLVEENETDAAIVDGNAHTACYKGHFDLVKYQLDYLSTKNKTVELDELLSSAAYGNQKKVAEYLVEKGANGFDGALKFAAKNGHISMIDFMIEHGATRLDPALISAVWHNQKEAAIHLIDLGAKNVEDYKCGNYYGCQPYDLDAETHDRARELVSELKTLIESKKQQAVTEKNDD